MPASIDTSAAISGQLVVFKAGSITCGLSIMDVQEIKKVTALTPLHHAPAFVRGVMNLRGRIVTIIDLRIKFGIAPVPLSGAMRIIVIEYQGEYIGLLADEVEDIFAIQPDRLYPAPANMGRTNGKYFSGLYKLDDNLIAILDTSRVLSVSEIADN